MKIMAIIVLLFAQSAFACNIGELRKDVVTFFKKQIPVETQLGEQKGMSKLKEIAVTDTMLRLRGEDFFMTKLVFDILWADGAKEERELLLAAVVDMANCKIETYESGDVFGASVSKK